MRGDIAAVLAAGGGVATLAELIERVPLRSVRRAVARGELVRAAPRVYAEAAGDPVRVMERAAVRSMGGLLSHLSALHRWGLRQRVVGEPVHVTVDRRQSPRPRPGVVVHRTSPLPAFVVREGLPVVTLERTLVDCWPVLGPAERREPVIRAVRERRTTAGRIRVELIVRPTLGGAGELSHLLGLLAAGCHSELEIWGVQRLFVIPGLPRPQLQYRVSDGRRTVYLDAAYQDVKLAVELDGAGYHSGADRERDLRRDTWLATLGWLVLRISYRRLLSDPIGAREEIAAAYEVRRLTRPWGDRSSA